MNADTPLEVLQILATNQSSSVRQKVAKHLGTPLELLQTLAMDEDVWVRRSVAQNPNASSEILRVLAKDRNAYIRNAVAKNSKTPPQELEYLLNLEKSILLCLETITQPFVSHEMLGFLLKTQNLSMSHIIVQYANIPIKTLSTLEAV